MTGVAAAGGGDATLRTRGAVSPYQCGTSNAGVEHGTRRLPTPVEKCDFPGILRRFLGRVVAGTPPGLSDLQGGRFPSRRLYPRGPAISLDR